MSAMGDGGRQLISVRFTSPVEIWSDQHGERIVELFDQDGVNEGVEDDRVPDSMTTGAVGDEGPIREWSVGGNLTR
jgi:hypothetical protein